MSLKARVGGSCVAAGLAVLTAIWLFGAPKPKIPNVQLKASFRALTNPELPGYDFYTDKIFNDNYDLGPYVTLDDRSVAVWFTPSDAGGTTAGGDLYFRIEHHAARRVNIVFPYTEGICGSLPDTMGLYPDLPDDPIDYFRFKTYNVYWYAPPHLNFLTMVPGETQQVKLETVVCSNEQHNFYLKYRNLEDVSSIVQVTAYDDDGDSILDRWELQPVAGTNGLLTVGQLQGRGKTEQVCNYGTYFMPFLLTLERVR